MELRRIDRYAAGHHGVITRDVASQLGVSRSAWYRGIESGALVQIHPGVARVHGSPNTFEQRVYAAVAACGDGALASHRSSARLLGVPRPASDPIDVIVANFRGPRPSGVVVHRPTDRDDLGPTIRNGIRCTNALRTLVDLGAVAPEAVPGALEMFVVDGSIRHAAVVALLDRHGRKGRHGVGALRRAIEDWPLGDAIPDSVLEVGMARLLRRYELPPTTFHARVAGFEVDFLVDDSPIVIECDGWTHHVANRDQWEFDLERTAKLSAEGYIVLHRTRPQIVFRAATTAARLRDLIGRWAPHLLTVG